MGVRDYANPATSVGGIGILGSNLVSNFDNALRQVVQDTHDGLQDGAFTSFGYVTKSGNYTVTAAEAGKIIDCTATLTLTLPAAASSTGFTFLVKANGANITLDANASELIDGLTTRVVVNGYWAMLTCTGTAWLMMSIPSHSHHYESPLVNGNFDVWQRDINQTANGYLSADQWAYEISGSTQSVTRQAITVGQTNIPGNPTYYSRTNVTSVAGANNYVRARQPIENVRTFAGQYVTLTFWAKHGVVAGDMAIEFVQDFGFGGSPSADVTGIGSEKITLTNTDAKYSRLIFIPSISGKTIGGNETSSLDLIFWFDAGSTYNSRTGSLGQLTHDVFISRVSVVAGDARNAPDPAPPKDYQTELRRCQRYYEAGSYYEVWGGASGSIVASFLTNTSFKVNKYIIPTITGTNDQGTFTSANITATGVALGRSSVVANRQNSGTFVAEAVIV
jgi:hypothetical protein